VETSAWATRAVAGGFDARRGTKKGRTTTGGDEMAKVDKLKGRVKQAAGDLIDDAELRRKGRLEEEEASARDELARSEEEADRKAEEVADLERRT
jgi:uncharacterized protein YjbJ (UPF0337 family)